MQASVDASGERVLLVASASGTLSVVRAPHVDGSALRVWATPGRGECAALDVAPYSLDVAAATSGGQLALLSLQQPGSQARAVSPLRRSGTR